MAKSLRSKRKRKVRAEKRIVNAKKELVKLKTIAARLQASSSSSSSVTKETLEQANLPHVQVHETPMLVDSVNGTNVEGAKSRTRLVPNNQWMNQRKIKSIKNKIKKHNQKKSRRGGLSSRKVKKGLK